MGARLPTGYILTYGHSLRGSCTQRALQCTVCAWLWAACTSMESPLRQAFMNARPPVHLERVCLVSPHSTVAWQAAEGHETPQACQGHLAATKQP